MLRNGSAVSSALCLVGRALPAASTAWRWRPTGSNADAKRAPDKGHPCAIPDVAQFHDAAGMRCATSGMPSKPITSCLRDPQKRSRHVVKDKNRNIPNMFVHRSGILAQLHHI